MDHSRLDSELAEALELFPELDVWDDLPAARVLRAKMTKELQADLPPVDGVTSTDYKVPGPEGAPNVFVRVYRPVSGSSNKSTNNNDALPGMLWIHGGGYVWGSVDGDDRTVRCLVEAVACVVVSVEYRLAPEHPFPAPLDDCYAVLKWLVANAEELGVDSSRIAIGGISAGAGLAAGLALYSRDQAEVELMFQWLICPMIDDRNSTASSHAITDPRVWNRDCNHRGWAAYLGSHHDVAETSGYAAASRAEDLSGLPPAYIPVGSLDLFVDENIEYAQRLNTAGVHAELHVFPGGYHAFEFLVPAARISRRARHLHYEALRSAFRG